MKQGSLYEALFQIGTLIFVIIIVHATYVTVIRPNAELIQEQQQLMQEQNPDIVPERSVFIIIRDYEQEFCIIFFLWAVTIIGMKTQHSLRQRALLERTLVKLQDGMSILPEDSRNYARPVQALAPRGPLLVRVAAGARCVRLGPRPAAGDAGQHRRGRRGLCV